MSAPTPPAPGPSEPQRLWTTRFAAINAIMFLTFCNMAVFFQFYDYLHRLPIAPNWFGLLIGLFALTALLIRPLISPWLTPANARKWIVVGCLGVIGSLLLYNLARDLGVMILVRAVHGLAYVVLASAVVAALVGCIPPRRSGQAFGLMAVVTLLPYAVVPPLVVSLSRWLGGYVHVLNLTALMMVPILGLAALLGPPDGEGDGTAGKRLRRADLARNLRDRRIWGLLLLSLLVFTAFTPVFFFVKSFAEKIGLANAGWFFTISTGTEIAVRLVLGPLFDKVGKIKLLVGSLALLVAAYAALANAAGPVLFFGLAVAFGLAWGVALPIINSLMFDFSTPRLRALNTNLGLEMFQGGFFLGPLFGGWILTGSSYQALFYVCGGLCLAALALVPLLRPGAAPGGD
jgi:predicted MFS family arabinose efflux permease